MPHTLLLRVSQFADRIKILRNGAFYDVQPAIQVILNCAQNTAGTCDGGDDVGVYEYFEKNGIPDLTCQQYQAVRGEGGWRRRPSASELLLGCPASPFPPPSLCLCLPPSPPALQTDLTCSPIHTCQQCVGPPGQGTCFAQPNYWLWFAEVGRGKEWWLAAQGP